MAANEDNVPQNTLSEYNQFAYILYFAFIASLFLSYDFVEGGGFLKTSAILPGS